MRWQRMKKGNPEYPIIQKAFIKHLWPNVTKSQRVTTCELHRTWGPHLSQMRLSKCNFHQTAATSLFNINSSPSDLGDVPFKHYHSRQTRIPCHPLNNSTLSTFFIYFLIRNSTFSFFVPSISFHCPTLFVDKVFLCTFLVSQAVFFFSLLSISIFLSPENSKESQKLEFNGWSFYKD